MGLTVLLGGARSGKSSMAVRMGARWDGPVTLIATAEARDEDMAARIGRHRAERPAAWKTIEEPVDVSGALRSCPDEAFVIVDCLTLWTSNLMERELDVRSLAAASAVLAAGRNAPVVAVSNEVGLGIHPADALSRRYRDLHGAVNAIWCEHAERALLVVAGRTLDLERMP